MSSSIVVQNSASRNSRTVRKRRFLGIAASAAVILYCFVLASFYYAMKQPPETFSRVMMRVGPAPFLLFPFETMWKRARGGALRIGDPAPSFRLPLLNGSGSVELSSSRGARPVVLVFGSYT